MALALRNLVFTLVVPGIGGVLVPWWILTLSDPMAQPAVWLAALVVAVGFALYVVCIWNFASVGRGTPGPWDAPQRFVAVGPYRCVRNPIYIAALLVVVGEALLYASLPVLLYAGLMALFFHLFVISYEEPTLTQRFGTTYAEYRASVSRWLPRPPHSR